LIWEGQDCDVLPQGNYSKPPLLRPLFLAEIAVVPLLLQQKHPQRFHPPVLLPSIACVHTLSLF
jgi:hypothetical protein